MKKTSSIATAILLLPTIFALAEEVPATSGIVQGGVIGEGGAITTTVVTKTRNGVAQPPVISVIPEGGEPIILNADAALHDLAMRKDFDALMQESVKKIAPQMRERLAEQQKAELSALGQTLGMSADEFDAIKPLIAAVDNLRKQKSIIDDPAKSTGGGASDIWRSNPHLLLGDTELDPTVVEIQKSAKGLKALIEDKQTNASELASAITRLRESRARFLEVLSKAQKDLRAVLTSPQEALLIIRGTLD